MSCVVNSATSASLSSRCASAAMRWTSAAVSTVGMRQNVISLWRCPCPSPRRRPTRSHCSAARGLPSRGRSRGGRLWPVRCAASPRGRSESTFRGLQLARCATCGLQFQSPRPVFDDLVQAVYGPAYHPPGEHVIDAVRRYQFERQMRWLDEVAAAGRRLLDVGCGSGAFLRFAQARGWEAEGTDVVVTPAAAATGARLWAGQLPSIAFGRRRYHAVRFNHVLEHTQDPLAELRAARAVLEPGGVLHVGVPNLAGFTITLKSWAEPPAAEAQAVEALRRAAPPVVSSRRGRLPAWSRRPGSRSAAGRPPWRAARGVRRG